MEAMARPQISDEEDKNQKLLWLSSVKKKLGLLQTLPLNTTSIYRIPRELRKINQDAYTPRITSIGPYHRGDPDLQAMEEHKWHYMLFLLHRGDMPVKCLDDFGLFIIEDEAWIRQSYSENIKLTQTELAKVILVDTCFILELFIRCWDSDFRDEIDPVFRNAWMLPALRHDLSLLENQIPFSVLVKLYEIILPSVSQNLPNFVTDLALHFFHPVSTKVVRENSTTHYAHLLDLLHKFYLSQPQNPPVKSEDMSIDEALERFSKPTVEKMNRDLSSGFGKYSSFSARKEGNWGFHCCASKLLATGVQFEKCEGSSLLDIDFDRKKGILKIPSLCIDEITESRFRNLIAFEQCSVQSTHHITSYTCLMKCLIHTPEDVKLLQDRGILKTNRPRKAEDFVALFDGLLKEVVSQDFYFTGLCDEVNKFRKTYFHLHRCVASCKVWYHRSIATLRRDYFPNSWRYVQFGAAFLLLVLSAIQAYSSVRCK